MEAGEVPGPEQDVTPEPCGPYAVERFWVRPTNNFGAWNEANGGVLGMNDATHEARVAGGGISYTMFPCGGAPDADCLRIDRLSVQLAGIGSGLALQLAMLDDPRLMPIADHGHFDIPSGALRLAVRYESDDQERLVVTTNPYAVRGRIDVSARTIRIDELRGSWEQEKLTVILALEASLTNSQPRTEIIHARNPHGRDSLLMADTFDADLDPIHHYWMIPGVGSWRGDTITPSLSPGRYTVILFADDVHRARGVAARWLDIAPLPVD